MDSIQKQLISNTLVANLNSVRVAMIEQSKSGETSTGGVALTLISNDLEGLRLKYSENLKDLSAKFINLKNTCIAEKRDLEMDAEMLQCRKEYQDCLEKVNEECLVQIGASSGVFIDAVSSAHSNFTHQLVELACIYGEEKNVDFSGIVAMFNTMHDHTRATSQPYKSCQDIHVFHAQDESRDALDAELLRHRHAAFINSKLNAKFEEDPKSEGYSKLCPILYNINEANRKAAARTRDFLINYTFAAFKSPLTWSLVRFFNDGTTIPEFIEPTGAQKDFSKQAVTEAMKQRISVVASKYIHMHIIPSWFNKMLLFRKHCTSCCENVCRVESSIFRG
jgi:hypothetical protein